MTQSLLQSKLIQFILAALLVVGSFSAQAAVDFEFKTLKGETVKLSDFRGKWVIVNYWATWCPPCRVEMPELGFFHEAHKNNDAVVLGVNYEEVDVSIVQKFLDQEMIKLPIVRQVGKIDGKSTYFGPLRGLPTTYMVSPKGEVVAARTGMVDQKMLEDFIKKFNNMK